MDDNNTDDDNDKDDNDNNDTDNEDDNDNNDDGNDAINLGEVWHEWTSQESRFPHLHTTTTHVVMMMVMTIITLIKMRSFWLPVQFHVIECCLANNMVCSA